MFVAASPLGRAMIVVASLYCSRVARYLPEFPLLAPVIAAATVRVVMVVAFPPRSSIEQPFFVLFLSPSPVNMPSFFFNRTFVRNKR